MVVLLLAGVLGHQPAPGVLGAAAALSVGFGAARRVRDSRLLAMLLTTLMMAGSAVTGTLAGNLYCLVILTTAIWGLACGFLNVLDEDIGWIAMQGVIALMVATSFPSHGLEAWGRGACILSGGLVQTGCILLIWRLEGVARFGSEDSPTAVSHKTPFPFQQLCHRLRESLVFSSAAATYALRVAVTLVIAVELDHLLKLKNGYWLPMTTVVVLKPDFFRTYTGGIQRSVGTLLGVLAASVIITVSCPENLVLVMLVGSLGFCAYAFQKVNAVVFSMAITSFAVFMIAVTGLPESTVIWHRLVNTCLGCALAVLSRFIGFSVLHPLLARPK